MSTHFTKVEAGILLYATEGEISKYSPRLGDIYITSRRRGWGLLSTQEVESRYMTVKAVARCRNTEPTGSFESRDDCSSEVQLGWQLSRWGVGGLADVDRTDRTRLYA